MQEKDFHLLLPGSQLNKRYTIISVLGEGGFGITYRGKDELSGSDVAIKEFYPHGLVVRNNSINNSVTVTNSTQSESFYQGKEKFLNEAMTIARFNSQDGIVNFTDFFEENNTVYIVMEYLDGITIKDYLKQNGRMDPQDVLGIFVPVIETLDEIHKQGLIHRDISPDNIMLMQNGNVKLMDFGAARTYAEFGEKSLSIVLKPGYAPEEQYRSRGVQGPWTDIYALSATMYKCITGITPEDSIQRMVEDSIKKPSDLGIAISGNIESALMKGLSVSAKNRYKNLKDFSEDLYRTDNESEVEEDKIEVKGVEAETELEETGNKERNYVSYGKSKKTITAVSVCIFFLISCFSFLLWQKSLEREVPSLVNMTMEEAVKVAAGEDGKSLKVEVSDSEYSDDIEKNRIISQDTDAGTILKKGDVIKVVLSKGALVSVPELTGKSQEEAEKQLQDSKLTYVVSESVYSNDVSKNHVVSQDVSAGSTVEEYSTVSVVISKGALVSVPDLVGKSVKKAKKKLKEAGLVYNESKSVYSDDIKKDHVISQDIPEGSTVEEKSMVSVVLSKGIEQVKVPDLAGKTVDDAKDALKKARLKFDENGTDYQYSDSVDSGHIISQSVEAGGKTDKNSKISCIISKGPKPRSSSRQKKSSRRQKSSRRRKKSRRKRHWTRVN